MRKYGKQCIGMFQPSDLWNVLCIFIYLFIFKCGRSSLSRNSCKQIALLTATFANPRLNFSSYKLCTSHIS